MNLAELKYVSGVGGSGVGGTTESEHFFLQINHILSER